MKHDLILKQNRKDTNQGKQNDA